MVMIGGDASALFGFAAQLRERRRNIARASSRLGAMLQEANWVGPDRDRFVNDWNERHAPSLMGICADLDSAAGQVTSHARVQEDVSQS
jgi:hypothetical protein